MRNNYNIYAKNAVSVDVSVTENNLKQNIRENKFTQNQIC